MPFAYYNDHDPDSVLWLRSLIARGLIADGEVDGRSILDVSAADLIGFTQCHFFAGIGGWSRALRLAGWPDDESVWTGSPPCQPFSAAGLQKGQQDERHLAPHFAELIAAGQPEFVFGEQVASAAVFGPANTPKSRAAKEPEWAWIDDLRLRLEAAHYAVGAGDIPAASVGAPHIRQRTFFGAWLQHAPSVERQQRGSEPGQRGIIGGCSDSVLADADDTGLEGCDGEHADPSRWAKAPRHSGPLRAVDGLADSCRGPVPQSQRGPDRGDGESAASDRMGNAELHGSRPPLGRKVAGSKDSGERRGLLQSKGPDPLADGLGASPHNFWSNADWIFCRDGKWRPIESSPVPLADGLSEGVGRSLSSPLVKGEAFKEGSGHFYEGKSRSAMLRGYGNAIVPQAAAIFITSFMESLGDDLDDLL